MRTLYKTGVLLPSFFVDLGHKSLYGKYNLKGADKWTERANKWSELANKTFKVANKSIKRANKPPKVANKPIEGANKSPQWLSMKFHLFHPL